MKNLHTLLLLPALALGMGLQAQEQYFVNFSGHHTPCTGEVQGNWVTIQSLPGTFPDYDIEVPINSNCYYTVTLEVSSPDYAFLITSGCTYPVSTTVLDTNISVPPGTTIALSVDFSCDVVPPNCQPAFALAQTMDGGEPVPFSMSTTNLSSGTAPFEFSWIFEGGGFSNEAAPVHVFPGEGVYLVCMSMTDAEGCGGLVCDSLYVDPNGMIGVPQNPDCLDIPNGPNVPGSACTTDEETPGTWNDACECIPNVTLPCDAGFWVIQAYTLEQEDDTTVVVPIPYELWIWNLSGGGTGNYQFTWDFGDGNSSTEAFPTHVYADSGPYTLCLTMNDDGGCTDTYCEEISVDDDGILGMMPDGGLVRAALTINVVQELPMSVPERPRLEVTRLWPNPVEDQLSLMLQSSRSGQMQLSILDMNGREVGNSTVGLTTGNNLLPIDVGALQPGMYIIRLVHGTNQAAMRFVKH